MSRGIFLTPKKSSTNRLTEAAKGYAGAIRDIRTELRRADPDGWPWAEIARRCSVLLERKVFPEQVGKWKDGKQEPTLAEFMALGEVLGVDPRDLAFAGYTAPPVAQNAPRGAGSGDASVVAVPRGKPLKGKRRAG